MLGKAWENRIHEVQRQGFLVIINITTNLGDGGPFSISSLRLLKGRALQLC